MWDFFCIKMQWESIKHNMVPSLPPYGDPSLSSTSNTLQNRGRLQPALKGNIFEVFCCCCCKNKGSGRWVVWDTQHHGIRTQQP